MKTVCIYHSIDLDGWMSAAIVKYYHEQSEVDDAQSITLDFIGYNYGQPIPDLSNYGRVIMCDISFPKIEMDKLFDKLVWIDHHKSSIIENLSMSPFEGLRNIEFAACELTWQYFFPDEQIPEIVRLLGRYDCFGHKGTEEERKVLEFQYGARQVITNYEEAYLYLELAVNPKKGDATAIILENGQSIYKYLCTEAKQSYKNGFGVVLQEPIEKYKDTQHPSLNRRFICINRERFNPINFGINYHNDGYDGCACFHFDGEMWSFSLYNDNGQVDCSAIAKQYGGGGHKGAAGMRLTTEEFNTLIRK